MTSDPRPPGAGKNAAVPSQGDGVRLDIWLWAARFFRTRGLAKSAVESGKVEANGQRAKPSRLVHAADVLRIERAGEIHEVTVRALSPARGPAPAAQALYEETDESRRRREALRAERAAARAGYRPPEGRPDKRARRLIRALGDLDAS